MKMLWNKIYLYTTYIALLCINSSITNAIFEVEFCNVGQGHCCVAKTKKNGVIIIDAGSSSAKGVDEAKKKSKPKNVQLATHVFSLIKDKLEESKKLNFIITHADNDHLNLAEPICRGIQREYDDIAIRFILGGTKKEYTNRAAGKASKDLIKFLDEKQIPSTYGENFTQNGVLWTPPAPHAFALGGGEKVEFISVKAAKVVSGKSEDKKNASSIVVKLTGAGQSVMIVGDKTKSELDELCELFEQKNKINELKADIFLASHHGSEEDFSEEWMEAVHPSYLVVSAGTSSFFHPRVEAVCSDSVLENLENLTLPWHPIRSFGALARITRKHLKRLIPVCSDQDENFRRTPYSYSMTCDGIYITADQGKITFKLENSNIKVSLQKNAGNMSYATALENFLLSRKEEWSELIWYPPSTLSKTTCKSIISLCTSLKRLDLNPIIVGNKNTDNIVNILTKLTNLSVLSLKAPKMSKRNKDKIRKAWGYRGLEFQ